VNGEAQMNFLTLRATCAKKGLTMANPITRARTIAILPKSLVHNSLIRRPMRYFCVKYPGLGLRRNSSHTDGK